MKFLASQVVTYILAVPLGVAESLHCAHSSHRGQAEQEAVLEAYLGFDLLSP